uniref:Uncharacterized protein n=1 Tax=Grammatophora oceanica TaxID=210454 RepID=A0A7S1UXT6_9STRA|mmetsp:Transcript_28703/g.42272  ORF Transcript_28703/g.42272 Transcript_28703/m.42272 type:complete len:611 (+) Transcript_28703:171-2003(+)|eukprot:CAMPEP_0194053368 /NCGR_PEP_ID=MMETSP0009_2-20130614/49526_1 /TAXON_ID=210454 /ORGANISM="Grammatophora oceanica, Strain CCMP 410" /LENGTH=610 /DNA_ID=CAMNT_0038701421 /DNA_START=102 /DNA_END=1934 /DNA_ORIENTATION=-
MRREHDGSSYSVVRQDDIGARDVVEEGHRGNHQVLERINSILELAPLGLGADSGSLEGHLPLQNIHRVPRGVGVPESSGNWGATSTRTDSTRSFPVEMDPNETRASSPGAFYANGRRAASSVNAEGAGSRFGRGSEPVYSAQVVNTCVSNDDNMNQQHSIDDSVVRGIVVSSLGHMEDDYEEVLYQNRLAWIIRVFVILLVATTVGTYLAVRSRRVDSLPRQGAEAEARLPPSASPSLVPTASPTARPTGIPWTDFGTPLFGSPEQQFGASVVLAGDILAIRSAGGSGLVQIFRVDRETESIFEEGLPIELKTENSEKVSIKLSTDGRHLAIALPSDDKKRAGKVKVYSSDRGENLGKSWTLSREVTGNRPSFGVSLDISEDGGRLVVASNEEVRAYDLTTDPPKQMGEHFPLLNNGYPVVVSITSSLLGIGQVRRRGFPCELEFSSDTCDDLGLVALYKFFGNQWEDAPTHLEPNTLSNSGPYHDLGSNEMVVALTRNRNAVRVFQFDHHFAAFDWVGNAIPLGRVVSLNDSVKLVMVKESRVAIAWDQKVAVYELQSGSWFQRGETIETPRAASTPSISLSEDGQLLSVGLVDGGDNSGYVKVYQLLP